MGIFSRLFRSRDKPTDRTAGSSYAFYMGGSSSGKVVTERSAMQMTAVYACVRILSEAIAGLPLQVYQYKDDGGKEKAMQHPLYHLLHDEPNPEMSSFVFRETLMTHLLLWGNAYAQVIRNGKDEVVALYPLMPNKMQVNRDNNGHLYYNTATLMTRLHRKEYCDPAAIGCAAYSGLATDWSATHRLRWPRTLSALQFATEEYGLSSLQTALLLPACWNIPAIKDPTKVRDAWMSQFGGSSIPRWPFWKKA